MIKGLNHVGISVTSLERSIEFYRDHLGMRVIVQKPFTGDRYATILGLEGATGRVAVLELGDMQLELFEFLRPSPKPSDPKRPVCDHGITHFCIEVTDIDSEYARLRAAGVPFHCPPIKFGAEAATYGRDPDGNVFEMLELTNTVDARP